MSGIGTCHRKNKNFCHQVAKVFYNKPLGEPLRLRGYFHSAQDFFLFRVFRGLLNF